MSTPMLHVSRRERRRRRRHAIYAGVSITVITMLLVGAMTYWVLMEWSAR